MSERSGGGELQALWGGAELRGQVMPLPTASTLSYLSLGPDLHIPPLPRPPETWALVPLVHPAVARLLLLRWEKRLSCFDLPPSQEVSGEGEKQPDEQSLQLW